jgi:hypothetical protein
MRNTSATPDESDESWECEECLDRDMEREPCDPLDPLPSHEDGYEKAAMVGFEPDEDDARRRDDDWAMDVNDQDAKSPSHLGMYGEG